MRVGTLPHRTNRRRLLLPERAFTSAVLLAVVDLVATNVASFADRVSAGGTFPAPFLYERRALRIKASDISRYTTLADFAGKRVGAVKGMAAERHLLKRAPPNAAPRVGRR